VLVPARPPLLSLLLVWEGLLAALYLLARCPVLRVHILCIFLPLFLPPCSVRVSPRQPAAQADRRNDQGKFERRILPRRRNPHTLVHHSQYQSDQQDRHHPSCRRTLHFPRRHAYGRMNVVTGTSPLPGLPSPKLTSMLGKEIGALHAELLSSSTISSTSAHWAAWAFFLCAILVWYPPGGLCNVP